MHQVFTTLAALQPQLARIEQEILRHDVGEVMAYLGGGEGEITISHSADKAYLIEWYAVVKDEDDDGVSAVACAALRGEDNVVELAWPLGGTSFHIHVELPDADGVMHFARHFGAVLERASRTCSLDEGFEIIRAAAALVAKG